MEKKRASKTFLFMVITLIVITIIAINGLLNETDNTNHFQYNDRTFSIIASSENKDLENVIKTYADQKGYNISIEYSGTLDIMQKLNSGKKYDAVWISNSIWLYMLDDNVTISNSKCTSINPVIFGIKKSKAQELGFVDKKIKTQDILDAVSSGKLKFSMSNPTSTNSGASAYLGLLSTLAGNPEVLTEETLQNAQLKEKVKTLFSGLERSSGSEEFLETAFLNGDYDAVVTYESSIININKTLIRNGQEPVYAVYPTDGVSISDSPFAYIDNKDTNKKEIFTDLQSYILSDEGQKLLQEKGRRTWYGGITANIDKTIFNPEWGIDTTQYISPIKYPSTKVIKASLNLYQSELRKPVHVVFCLDYSGSMYGDGNNQLVSAMQYILSEEASKDFIQFSEKDKIDIIPFSSKVKDIWSTNNGSQTNQILERIEEEQTTGNTAIYPAAINALQILKGEDTEKYNVSVILMTDGLANVGTYSDLNSYYKSINKEIPIYSIMFGSADESQLSNIAKLTNAKIFDGKTDLIKAFKEVRGYN